MGCNDAREKEMNDQVSVDDLKKELEELEFGAANMPTHPSKLADALEPVLASYVLQYRTYIETARIQKDIGNDEEVARLISHARPLLASIKAMKARIEELRTEAAKDSGGTLSLN